MTSPGRPTSPPTSPPPRPSSRASVVAQRIADHPNPVPQLVAGVLAIAASVSLVHRQYPVSLADKIFDGVPFAIGVCILPTMPTWIAAGAKLIGGAVGPYLPWGKKDGGAS